MTLLFLMTPMFQMTLLTPQYPMNRNYLMYQNSHSVHWCLNFLPNRPYPMTPFDLMYRNYLPYHFHLRLHLKRMKQ